MQTFRTFICKYNFLIKALAILQQPTWVHSLFSELNKLLDVLVVDQVSLSLFKFELVCGVFFHF